MYLIQENEIKQHDYVRYARQFDSYKWYKPILTMLFFVIFYVFLTGVLLAGTAALNFMITGGDVEGFLNRFTNIDISYESMDVRDPINSLIWLGGIAVMIPALWFARGIVRERPFSSYTSSRGGWSMWIFIKCLIISLLVCALPAIAYEYYLKGSLEFHNQFAKYGLICLLVLCPLQCIAEEYIFRGLINQALGAWVKIPILAIIISSVGFAALHPYNNLGILSVFVTGVCLGLTAWIGRGIEVSSALHIVNNMSAMLFVGFGIDEISSEIDSTSALMSICIDVLYVVIIFIISKATNWFDKSKFDDAENHNDDLRKKRNKKEAKRAAKAAKKRKG